MTWVTFLTTMFVIGVVVVDLIILRINPNHAYASIWLQKTFFGSPQNAFLLSFLVGGFMGYLEPNYPKLPQYDLSEHTAWFCTAIVILLVVWDAVVVAFGGVESSISRWVQSTAFQSPLATGGAGFLCGHFFKYYRV